MNLFLFIITLFFAVTPVYAHLHGYEERETPYNINPPHESIYVPINATIVSIDNYYSIEFEKNDSIQLPILNLEVISSEHLYVYFDIVETPGYIADHDPIDNNLIAINLNPLNGAKGPYVRIRLRMTSGGYRIKFDGTKWLP